MKRKTINTVLAKVHKDWVDSIASPKVSDLARKNTIITGGCIASMLLREKVNDYDIYFTNKETVEAVANYYVDLFNSIRKSKGIKTPIKVVVEEDRVTIKIKSAGVAGQNDPNYDYFEMSPNGDQQGEEYLNQLQRMTEQLKTDNDDKPKYQPVFMSTNAITLSHKVQLVLRFYGEPDAIHENYDYVHCTNYWTPTTKTVLRPDALEALLAKELRYVGSKYPLCSIFRVRKFIRRGWSINAGQMLKMAMQLNDLDLTNIEVLEDQLTGVDVAYFIDVIQRLRAKDPAKVDSAYLVEIIDKMF